MKFWDYLISTMVFILLTACIYGILNKKNDNVVENYCSEKYSCDVQEYKKCKDLNINKLVIKITNEVKENKKEIELPEVKL